MLKICKQICSLRTPVLDDRLKVDQIRNGLQVVKLLLVTKDSDQIHNFVPFFIAMFNITVIRSKSMNRSISNLKQYSQPELQRRSLARKMIAKWTQFSFVSPEQSLIGGYGQSKTSKGNGFCHTFSKRTKSNDAELLMLN